MPDRMDGDGLFFHRGVSAYHSVGFKKIDRSSAIVAETEQIPNRENSPLNSKSANF
jgi:hypothetical protein